MKVLNTIKSLATAVLICLCVTSCDWFSGGREVNNISILFYIAANNSLSLYAETSVEDLLKGYIPAEGKKESVLLVYYHDTEGAPTLSRYTKNKKGEVQQEVLITYPTDQNSSELSVFKKVLSDADEVAKTKRHGLILWSHATGWLPEGYYHSPSDAINWGYSTMSAQESFVDPYADIVKSFSEDDGKEIDIKDIAAALTHHYEFILFDCCLMGCIEVAFELRNNCDYIIFSPTEILAQGFPYSTIMDPLFNGTNREEALKSVCKQYFDMYDANSGAFRSATVTMVRSSYLNELASVTKSIFANNRSKIAKVNPADIQKYFRYNKNWFYDFGDYISRIASEAEYAQFTSTINNAVVYKAATEHFLDIPITNYSGLSTYIPIPSATNLNKYYKTLSWNNATQLIEK